MGARKCRRSEHAGIVLLLPFFALCALPIVVVVAAWGFAPTTTTMKRRLYDNFNSHRRRNRNEVWLPKSRNPLEPSGGWMTVRRSSSSGSSDNDDTFIIRKDYSYLERVREEMLGAGFEKEWQEAVRILTSRLASSSLESVPAAEDALAVALNWKRWAIVTSPMARKFIKTIPPNATELSASLDWLLDQGPLASVLSQQAMQTGILQCPASYLLSPQVNYQTAFKAYAGDLDRFHAVLSLDPTALQCQTNCAETGCQSDCGSCWVAFSNRRQSTAAAASSLF